MAKDLKRKFARRQLQARKKALASIGKTTLQDGERIDALEDAVLVLLSNASQEVSVQTTKLYDHMVKLDKIKPSDIPANLKPIMGEGIKPNGKEREKRKGDTS